MNKYARDPLLWVSVLLAATGAVQASTGLLSEVASRYPVAFGVAMTMVSVATAVLTAIKTAMLGVETKEIE